MPESNVVVTGSCTANSYRIYTDVGSGGTISSIPSSEKLDLAFIIIATCSKDTVVILLLDQMVVV